MTGQPVETEEAELLRLLREARRRAAWLNAARARLHQAKLEHDDAAKELEAFLAGTGRHRHKLRDLLSTEGLVRITRTGRKGLMSEAEFRALWERGGVEAVVSGHLHPIRRKVVLQRAQRLGLYATSTEPRRGWLSREEFAAHYRRGGVAAVMAASPPGTRRKTVVIRVHRLKREAPHLFVDGASTDVGRPASPEDRVAVAASRRSRRSHAQEDR